MAQSSRRDRRPWRSEFVPPWEERREVQQANEAARLASERCRLLMVEVDALEEKLAEKD